MACTVFDEEMMIPLGGEIVEPDDVVVIVAVGLVGSVPKSKIEPAD